MAELFFNLAFFHEREDKPAWWAVYDRAQRETDELIEDLESLGGLEAKGPASPLKRSMVRTYTFPAQDTKIRAGDDVRTKVGLKTVTVEQLRPEDNLISVKFGPSFGAPPPDTLDLIPRGPRDNEVVVSALRTVISSILDGEGRYLPAERLLFRSAPKFSGSSNPLLNVSDGVREQVFASTCVLDFSVLPIQGPPGTGKTYVSSYAITKLVHEGYRVAVASHSHKAIDNLMLEVMKRAEECGMKVDAIKKVSGDDPGPEHPKIAIANSPDDPLLLNAKLVGGTVWLFSRDCFDQHFDYLFVDEAGQVSLANTSAMSRCARNLVLVGDPMQLPQPVQGSHPGDSALSGLEYLLNGARTVTPAQGIFLPRTRRMHPKICKYISDHIGSGTIHKVDPARNKLALSFPAALVGAEGSIAAAFGSVWAVTAENGNKTLTRYKSADGSTEAEITLPSRSSGVIADFDDIWVASAGRDEIYRVDPITNTVKATIPLHARPRIIASGEGAIWALHLRDGTVSRIDAKSGEVVAKIAAEALDNDGDIAVGGGYVWVATRILPVIKIDPQSNSRVGSYRASGNTILGRRIRYGDGSLWVSGGSIFRIAVP
jgi:uncharacterized protein